MFTIFVNEEEIVVTSTKRDALLEAKTIARDMFTSDNITIVNNNETVCSFNGSVLY